MERFVASKSRVQTACAQSDERATINPGEPRTKETTAWHAGTAGTGNLDVSGHTGHVGCVYGEIDFASPKFGDSSK
jgi:hypothetical protein